MDIEEIKKLMASLEESKLRKMVIKKGDFEIHLEKEGSLPPPPASRRAPPHEEPFAHEPVHPKGSHSPSEMSGSFITSPMVGTFYSTPSPENPPFVKVGDLVQEGTVVCIIEAMKVMNEVKAGMKGQVAEVLGQNGQPVEFGSKLFRIVP